MRKYFSGGHSDILVIHVMSMHRTIIYWCPFSLMMVIYYIPIPKWRLVIMVIAVGNAINTYVYITPIPNWSAAIMRNFSLANVDNSLFCHLPFFTCTILVGPFVRPDSPDAKGNMWSMLWGGRAPCVPSQSHHRAITESSQTHGNPGPPHA
jgi:hypothetical protein